MTNSSNIHVVFGAGPLGIAVVEALVKQGKRVRSVTRSVKHPSIPGVEMVSADASKLDQAVYACERAEVVYQCAAPPYQNWVSSFPSLQSNILEGAVKTNARLVLAENLYMYGEVDGQISETLPYRPSSRKGKVRAEMTEAAFKAHKEGKLQVTSVRGSDFFGPRVMGSVLGERVFQPAVSGKPANGVGDLDKPHTFTFIHDFAKAMVLLGESEDAYGQSWHAPNAETLTQREMIGKIYQIAGFPPKMQGMGRFMMSIGGLFIPEARESIEMLYEFEKPFVVDSSKITAVFGIKATPLEQALRETVDWYKQI